MEQAVRRVPGVAGVGAPGQPGAATYGRPGEAIRGVIVTPAEAPGEAPAFDIEVHLTARLTPLNALAEAVRLAARTAAGSNNACRRVDVYIDDLEDVAGERPCTR